jgi:uncharacterized protein involved in tolerance to divalent cations
MIFIYVPCQNIDTAKVIGKILIEKGMAGKIDVIPMHSIYKVEGGVTMVPRVVMIIKTVDKHIQGIEDIVRENYHDGVPCIASISLYRMNRDFKDWLINATS